MAPDDSDSTPAYRRTYLDRTGPDGALLLRALGYAVVALACFVLLFATLAAKERYSPLLVVPLAVVATALVVVLGMHGARIIGAGFRAFVAPSGSSTPSEPSFSYEDSLAAKGDVRGALEAFETVIGATPTAALGGIEARIRAADLYAREGNDPQRAAQLFREVQRAESVPAGRDVYVSYRLMDLYAGPLRDPRRVLVELRRLVDRYPGTDVAASARATLATLKARRDDVP